MTSHKRRIITSAASFTASSAPGMKLWLEADTGITLNGASSISAWADQSGAGNNYTMSTALAQPQLVTNALNGKPAVSFDGSAQYFNGPVLSSIITAAAHTIYAVLAIVSAGAPQVAVYTENPVWTDAGEWAGIFFNNTPRFAIEVYTTSANASLITGVSLGTFYSIRGKHDSGALTSALNGGADAGSVAAGNGVTLTNATYIGRSGVPKYGAMKLAALLAYNQAHTTANETTVESYLRTKYGHY